MANIRNFTKFTYENVLIKYECEEQCIQDVVAEEEEDCSICDIVKGAES